MLAPTMLIYWLWLSCLIQLHARGVLEYVLSVSFDDNQNHQLEVCEGDKPVDAVANFLVHKGHHDRFTPHHDLMVEILQKVCDDTRLCQPITSPIPSKYASPDHPFVTLDWGDDRAVHTIYVREGYTSQQMAHCVCSKTVCRGNEQSVIQALLDGEMDKWKQESVEKAAKRELTRFSSRSCYVVLGLADEEGAAGQDLLSLSDAAVKRAYMEMAKRYHPDKHPSKEWATGVFRNISAAYEVLSDPSRRRQHEVALGLRREQQPVHQWALGNVIVFGGAGITIIFT